MNKRPLPCVLAGFVLGEVWIWQFHGTAAFAALCFAAIMCVRIGRKRKGSFFCLLFLSLGMILGGISRFQWEKNKADMSYWMSCSGCSIEGQISEIIEKESSYAVVADKLIINGKRQKGKLLIYLSDPGKVPVGGRISCHGRIESFEKSSNPGGFDQASYREGRGILGVVWKAEEEKIHYGSFLIVDGIYQIRKNTQEYLEQNL